MEEIKFELMEGGIMPKEVRDGAGVYELALPSRVSVGKGRQVIPIGFKVQLPKGKMAMILSTTDVQANGMSGWLSESNGKLVNCAVKEGVVTEERYNKLCEQDDVYWMEMAKKINMPNGETYYQAMFRKKVYESIRIPMCDVKLTVLSWMDEDEVCMVLDNRDVNFYMEKGQVVAQMLVM